METSNYWRKATNFDLGSVIVFSMSNLLCLCHVTPDYTRFLKPRDTHTSCQVFI